MSEEDLKQKRARRAPALLVALSIGVAGVAWAGCGDDGESGGEAQQGIEKGTEEAEKGIEKGTEEAEKGIKKGTEEAKQGIEKGTEEAKKGIEKGTEEAEKYEGRYVR